jgi:hypothetical protein
MSNMGDSQDGDFGRAAAQKEEALDKAVARGEADELTDEDPPVRPGGKADPAGAESDKR